MFKKILYYYMMEDCHGIRLGIWGSVIEPWRLQATLDPRLPKKLQVTPSQNSLPLLGKKCARRTLKDLKKHHIHNVFSLVRNFKLLTLLNLKYCILVQYWLQQRLLTSLSPLFETMQITITLTGGPCWFFSKKKLKNGCHKWGLNR